MNVSTVVDSKHYTVCTMINSFIDVLFQEYGQGGGKKQIRRGLSWEY